MLFRSSSTLVQLQNQNNPLSEISYTRKISVLGLGGFSSSNTTLAARNINPSYYGRYDLVETPEGQKIGLIHNLTIGSRINDYDQIEVPYYPVLNGIIVPQLTFLTNEQELDKYITHANIEIDEEGKILNEMVPVRYQDYFVEISRKKVNYIDSSFYQMNSITSSIIPFFHHNDATRMLMASNMQRQAVTLLKNEPPLVSSGIEFGLLDSSSLTIKAEEEGEVEYANSQEISIRSKNDKIIKYKLKQSIISNKNTLNFSIPSVKEGEKINQGQIISHGNYGNGYELSLGYNLRVAYLC